MKKVTVEEFQKLRVHNQNVMAKTSGTLDKKDVRDMYERSMDAFGDQIVQTRMGRLQDAYGRNIAPYDVSLDEALKVFYGVDMLTYMKQMDIHMGTDTLASAAKRFGNDNLTNFGLTGLLVKHSEFDGLNNTGDINTSHRFIIPELIMAAIRTDYEHTSMYRNWIATEQNISQMKITMPIIKRGSATPRKLGEGESIPFGTVRFGQKEATVYKIGIGFKITDELVEQSSLNMLFNFLGEVGTDMSIGADVEAINILINGEQSDASESAPVVGVGSTVTGYTYKDLKRVVARMERLKRNVTRVITGETDGLDIALLEEFKGFAGDTKLGNINGILAKILTLANDIWIMPSNQVMLLDPNKAMAKLKYRGMKTETRRNPQNQEEELFVSDHIGFAILRRDARVILDKSVTYNATAGQTGGFPTYMDVDARINNAFKNLQGI